MIHGVIKKADKLINDGINQPYRLDIELLM